MSPNQPQRTCQIRKTHTPNRARKTGQIRLKIHAKSGSKNTPNQVQTTRQIRLKLHAKSGSNFTPNQAQTARQIRLALHAKSGSNCTQNRPLIRAACYRCAQKREKRNTDAAIRSSKLCCAEKATHLKSKRKASILNFGQPRKTEGRDAYICL